MTFPPDGWSRDRLEQYVAWAGDIVDAIRGAHPRLEALFDAASNRFPLSPFLVFGPRVNWDVPGREGLPTAHFNAQGFRSPHPVQPKQPGQLRIITLGMSGLLG